MIDKKELIKIKTMSKESRKCPKNRALMVIETLVSDDLECNDTQKLKDDIYRIAHSAITPKYCEHKDWVAKTEEMFEKFR